MNSKRTKIPGRNENFLPSPQRTGFALHPEVAAPFVRKFWEKLPVLFSQPLAAPLISPEEVFLGIVNAADQFRAGDEEIPLRFYIENAQLTADVGKHLPALADRTTTGYAKRISRMLGGRRFALIAQNFQAFAPDAFLRFKEFLHGLSGFIDLPREETKATVFLGNYRKTPAGLHAGASSNFKFIVEGRKRMRLWPDQYLRGKEGADGTTDYARFVHAATSLVGKPGDVIYWPSDNWHIGEPVGGLAVSVSLALFVHKRSSMLRSAREHAIAQTEALMEDPVTASRHATLNRRASAIPKATRQTLAAFRRAIEGPELARAIKAELLNQATGFGFSQVPPPSPHRRLRSDAVVQADSKYPIQWLRGEPGEFICSANGHAFSLFAHPAVLVLFARLNRGEPCHVQSLIDRYAESARVDGAYDSAAREIRALLEKLCGLRALSERPAAARSI